jgi:hypothetical protein
VNEDGSNPSLLFKSFGTIEAGKLDSCEVQAWAELVPGFERTFTKYIAIPPSQKLIWLRPPNRKSFLPSLPKDLAVRIEVQSC